MEIDLSLLSETELIDLNNRIIKRLRMIRQVHAHVKMMEFSIGERVWFQTDVRKVEGVLVRYNKKSVTARYGPGRKMDCIARFPTQDGHQRFPTPKQGGSDEEG